MYEIQALRSDRAVYYVAEYGCRRAIELLRTEPKIGMVRVRTLGGTAKRTCGMYACKKHAAHDLSRVREMIAAMNTKRTGHLCVGGSAEIVKI